MLVYDPLIVNTTYQIWGVFLKLKSVVPWVCSVLYAVFTVTRKVEVFLHYWLVFFISFLYMQYFTFRFCSWNVSFVSLKRTVREFNCRLCARSNTLNSVLSFPSDLPASAPDLKKCIFMQCYFQQILCMFEEMFSSLNVSYIKNKDVDELVCSDSKKE